MSHMAMFSFCSTMLGGCLWTWELMVNARRRKMILKEITGKLYHSLIEDIVNFSIYLMCLVINKMKVRLSLWAGMSIYFLSKNFSFDTTLSPTINVVSNTRVDTRSVSWSPATKYNIESCISFISPLFEKIKIIYIFSV